MYSLNCSYYNKSFKSIYELIEDIMISGMDPDYEITRDGKSIGEKAIDYISFQCGGAKPPSYIPGVK